MDRIRENLFIGDAAEAGNELPLKGHTIKAVVRCCRTPPPAELYKRLGIRSFWVPFHDGARFGKDTHKKIRAAFRFIKARLGSGEAVLVHCRVGISRSPALIISYLYWSGGAASFEEACDAVREAHPSALPHHLVLASFKDLLGLAIDQASYTAFWENETAKRDGA